MDVTQFMIILHRPVSLTTRHSVAISYGGIPHVGDGGQHRPSVWESANNYEKSGKDGNHFMLAPQRILFTKETFRYSHHCP